MADHSSKRILYWSERFWPTIGGVGVSATKLLPALRNRGYEIAVVTARDYLDLPEADFYNGIPVYRFCFWSSLTARNLPAIVELRNRIVRLKESFSPNLVHIGFVGSTVLFHDQTASARSSPVLVSTDSGLPNDTLGRDSLIGKALRTAAWVTCVSAARLGEARRLIPEITSRSSCIYNGREIPACDPEPLSFDPPLLLCLGRLDQVKGFDIALSAFASVRALFPQARLVIAGDGSERAALERQVFDLGLQDKVEFIGWVAPDKVPELMNSATVVLIPSRNEGLPNVAKEAALMRRPIVATEVGGIPEAVVHGETGLLVDKEDPGALACAIGFLLGHQEVARAMGEKGRLRTRDVFSMERYVDNYDALYRKLIDGRAASGLGS